MISFARPTPAEERWLAVAAALGGNAAPAEVTARTGGWRRTGTLARIAMFVLGLLAAALVAGIFSLGGTAAMLIAGGVAAFAAESLARGKRLFASGIEEGLCLGGWMLLAGWALTLFDSFGFANDSLFPPVLIGAAAAAGLRLLNPFITTVAVIEFVRWLGSKVAEWPMFTPVGASIATLVIGCALAAVALWLGGRHYERPSHDRMLDWLVASLPILSYIDSAPWMVFNAGYAAHAGHGSWLPILILAVLGLVMLITALRRRRHAPLVGFMGCVVAVGLELRFAVALPTEVWLIGYGLAALIVGVALDRYLREPRDGFTSQPLSDSESPLDVLQTAGAAVLTHSSHTAAPQPDASVAGGGGRFGGGGASGSY
jgi:hypothetical protein